MLSRRLILGLAAALLVGSPALAQTRTIAVTFDDLPYQATSEVLCDPVRTMVMTRNFLAMLPPNARSTMAIDVKILSQAQKSLPATLALKFSACKYFLLSFLKHFH